MPYRDKHQLIRMKIPGYWMNEESGVLRPAVESYLLGKELTPREIVAMRAHLRQWIENGYWGEGPEVDGLRDLIGSLTTTAQIRAWIDRSTAIGIDPL